MNVHLIVCFKVFAADLNSKIITNSGYRVVKNCVFSTEETFKIVVTIRYHGGHTTEYELNVFVFFTIETI